MCLKYNSLANVQRIDYTQYKIQNILMLYAMCEVFSVFAIHYKYMVLEKIMRRTEMIDRPS